MNVVDFMSYNQGRSFQIPKIALRNARPVSCNRLKAAPLWLLVAREFGNLLILGEQEDGLIIDWELFKEEVPADTRLVRPAVERAERGLAVPIKCLVTDRGFDNKTNLKWLEGRGTFAGLCPRDPRALRAQP
jgi:hypothetical protein